MDENVDTENKQNHHRQVGDVSIEMLPQSVPRCVDDDGCPKRTGTLWTASAHITLAMACTAVLWLAWDIAQLGWIAGPAAMFFFSFVYYYTSCLLSDCYRTGDPVSGHRNRTYMDAVHSILGGVKVKACGLIQYLNLFGMASNITVGASISMMAIKYSNCSHESNWEDRCYVPSNLYMIIFGIIEILLSQIPDFDQIWWVSIVSVVMFFTYSLIGLGLGIARVAASGSFKGNLTGMSVEAETETQKIWRSFQALGDIGFVYSFSEILIEIQDTIRSPPSGSPPSEATIMKKAISLSTVVLTILYMLGGCMGYAALGDATPRNLLTDFAFYKPFWLIDIANAAIVISLVGTYQVYSQPIFAFIEKQAAQRWPRSEFIAREIRIPVPGLGQYNTNLFRLAWRTVFVIVTTLISMLFPSIVDAVTIISLGFWPLTVYFPVEMYIKQKQIPRWSPRWLCLQMLSTACLGISIIATAGSIAGLKEDLKSYRPFRTIYYENSQTFG